MCCRGGNSGSIPKKGGVRATVGVKRRDFLSRHGTLARASTRMHLAGVQNKGALWGKRACLGQVRASRIHQHGASSGWTCGSV